MELVWWMEAHDSAGKLSPLCNLLRSVQHGFALNMITSTLGSSYFPRWPECNACNRFFFGGDRGHWCPGWNAAFFRSLALPLTCFSSVEGCAYWSRISGRPVWLSDTFIQFIHPDSEPVEMEPQAVTTWWTGCGTAGNYNGHNVLSWKPERDAFRQIHLSSRFDVYLNPD